MTRNQITKIIKEELKSDLPNFLFKKDTGNNLYFFKEEDDNFYYKLAITVFSTGGKYMISTHFVLISEPLEMVFHLIMKYTPKFTIAYETTFVTYSPYKFADAYVSNEIEVKEWITELKGKFNKGFLSLKESSSLAYLETTFNKDFLDKKVDSFTKIPETKIIKGIILAKRLNKPYYKELVNKAYKVYEHLRSVVDENYTDDNIVKTVKFLDNFTIAQLNDIEYLKKQIE